MNTHDTAIVGAALSDCGRVDDKTAFTLHYQAASRAIADAGLSRDDIDGFGSAMGSLPPIEMAEMLGLRPTWIDSTTVGGNSWEIMLEHAIGAIVSGHATTVLLVYGSTSRADLKRRLRNANLAFSSRGPSQFEAPWGLSLMAKYAMVARRHMHDYGTTIEQFANIAVDTRWNASHNPDAYYQDLITVDDVQSSKLMADPFTKLHCCIRSDGGGAIVITSADRARDLAKQPVWILGSATAASHTTMSEWEDFTLSPSAESGRLAFCRAGLTPADVDLCQFYDGFTSMVLLTYEALGFCGRGEAGPYLEGGTMRLDGKMPTNTDGGGLSSCQPGMRGMFLMVEAVRQLRKEAVGRQVPDAHVCCVNAVGGWFSTTSTVLLGVD